MQAPLKSAAKIALAASCVAALLTGCKRPAEQADDNVQLQLVAAREQLNKSQQDPAVAISYFQKATSIADASDQGKIRSQLGLADANARAGDALIDRIEQRQVAIIALTTLINQQAARIQANNTQIAGLRGLDPKSAQDALAKLQASAQGGSDAAPWMAADAGAIPSAAGAKASVAAAKDAIDKLTTQKNNLQTQRAQLIQQADQLQAQSDAAKGKSSVDLFTQSADLIKQAAGLAAQSDELDGQISARQQELALAEATEKQIDAALDSLGKQSDQIKQGWTDMQKVIQDRSDQNAAIVNAAAPDASAAPADAAASPTTSPSSDAPATIAGGAAAIDKLKSDNSTSRDLAEKYFNDSLSALKAADTARATLVRAYSADVNNQNLSAFPQREAWQGMIDVYNPSDMKLRMAMVDLRLARLYSAWATTTSSRARSAKLVDAVLTPASLTAPETLKAGALDDEVANAKKKAEDAFSDADQLLNDVQKAPSIGPLAKGAQGAAQAVQVIELYSHAKFADAMGDPAGKELLKQSRDARDQAQAAGVAMPTLPPEIALAPVADASATPAPPPAASAPAPAPTATPATTPPAGPASGVFNAPDGATPAPAATPATAPAATPAPDATPPSTTPPAATPAPGTTPPTTPPQ